jgi:hypothetical protein
MGEPVDAYAAILEALDRNHAAHLESQRLQIELQNEIKEHIESEKQAIADAVKEGIASVSKDAFPKGDAVHHREWHERSIEAKRKLKSSLMNLFFEVLKWAALAILGWLGLLIWQGILKGLTP